MSGWNRGALSSAMKTRSILLVTSSYLPIMGGSEIEAQRVSQALMKRGHRVRIVCPGGPPMPAQSNWTDDCGVPVRTFGGGMPRQLRGYIFALRVAWMVLAERSRYDLVYFLMPGLQVTLGMLAARLARKPSMMKFSGSNEIQRVNKSRMGRVMLRFLDLWSGAIMILNPGMAGEAAECGLRASKLLWMPNPVDLDVFCPLPAEVRSKLRARLAIPQDAEVVLFVGRLAPEKELPSLVKGFGKVAALRPRAMLLLVGEGPCREELQTLAGQVTEEGRIRFAGATPSSAVPQWMQIAEVFALVSSFEGLPVSLIEAMATGVPAVVSDIPANRQLVDTGVEGVVVETRNADAIGAALESLLGDSELRSRLGAAGRARIAGSFSTPRVVELYESLFVRLLEKVS